MNGKQKEILQVQRSLLSKNIVWSAALASSLRAQNLLTDSMIAQIEAAQGAENKILVMLDLLPLRTSQVYDKFADALHLSGHTLIADFLREEDISKQPLNVKDLFKRLPFLSKNLKDNEKKQIEGYMSEKIQSGILAHTWSWNTKEKDKALVAKQEQLEQAHLHEQQLRTKQEQLIETQKQLKEAKEQAQSMKAELRAVADNATRLQQQMRGQMDTQMKFSMANDSIAQRTTNRLQTAEAILRDIQEKLQAVVELSPRTKERDLMRLAENPFFFLCDDVDAFLTQFRRLLVVQLKYDDLTEERNYILNHLGVPAEKIKDDQEQAPLLKAYKDFVAKNDARIENLELEVARYTGLLEEVTRAKQEEQQKLAAAGTVWQNAIMSVMRKQLQDLKAAMRKKDSTVGIKDAEITKLRSKVSELEAALAAKTREAELVSRTMAIPDLHNGHHHNNGHASSLDSLEPPVSTSPRHTNNNTPGLPPLKSAVSNKTAPSPRHGGGGGGPPRAGKSGGVVVRIPKPQPRVLAVTEAPLTMFPAGLTTMQLRVDPSQTHHSRVLAPSTADPRAGKPPMGTTLGDLRAMHSRYPGIGSRGVAGGSLDMTNSTTTATSSSSPVPASAGAGNAKAINSSPATRRKIIQAHVK